MTNGRFDKLFEPITIHGMTLRNRIVMPPMDSGYGSTSFEVTDQLLAYYRRRAQGGVGLIIVEYTSVDPGGRCVPTQLGVYDDRFIPGLRRLTDAAHAHGAKIALQLHHGGVRARPEHSGGRIVGPSAIADPTLAVVPDALTVPEIERLVEAFGAAAERAKRAGFDMVEIHGAHGYLVNEFLSPWYNRRTDEYGGDFERRLRFALEVVQRVRQAVGPDFPVGIRIVGEEIGGEGLTVRDTLKIAPRLAAASVDVIDVSVGTLGTALGRVIVPTVMRPGVNVYLAEAVKHVVDVPVITVGRINDPSLADQIVRDGHADLVAMGRALMADPELPVKAAEGRVDEIRKCFACMECSARPYRYCSTNPELGREAAFEVRPAAPARDVWVVGGGIGGLEAATLAAQRGHRVTLFERGEGFGGQMPLAAAPPHKEDLMSGVTSRVALLDKAGVKVRLGTPVTAEMVERECPDVVILATGSRPWLPPIPGIDRPNVVTAKDLLGGKAFAGPRVVVLGGGMVGAETAEWLGDRRHEVTIVEMLPAIAGDMVKGPRDYLMHRLHQYGVQMITGARVEAITDQGVVVSRDGKQEVLDGFQTVVLALGNKPNAELVETLRSVVSEVYVIGDAVKSGKIMDATAQAAEVALKI